MTFHCSPMPQCEEKKKHYLHKSPFTRKQGLPLGGLFPPPTTLQSFLFRMDIIQQCGIGVEI